MTRRMLILPAILALATGLSLLAQSATAQIHVSTRGIDPMHSELCPVFPNRAFECEYSVCHYADAVKFRDHVSLASKPESPGAGVPVGCGDATWYDEHSTWVNSDEGQPVADDARLVEGDVNDTILDANEYDYRYDYDLVDSAEPAARIASTAGTGSDQEVANDPYQWDADSDYDYEYDDYDYQDSYYEQADETEVATEDVIETEVVETEAVETEAVETEEATADTFDADDTYEDVSDEYDYEDAYYEYYEQNQPVEPGDVEIQEAPASELSDPAYEVIESEVDDYYYGDYDYGYDESEQYDGSESPEEVTGTLEPQAVMQVLGQSVATVSRALVTGPAVVVMESAREQLECWMCETGVEEAWYMMVDQFDHEPTYPVSAPVCYPLDPMDDHCGYDCELWYDYQD